MVVLAHKNLVEHMQVLGDQLTCRVSPKRPRVLGHADGSMSTLAPVLRMA
jgi:hypothetical protein